MVVEEEDEGAWVCFLACPRPFWTEVQQDVMGDGEIEGSGDTSALVAYNDVCRVTRWRR
jgi:hypothetical protein